MTLLVFTVIPIVALWLLVLVDIAVRPDLSGLRKLVWMLASTVFWPSMIAYLLSRPLTGRLDEAPKRRGSARRAELVQLVALRQAGRVSPEDFQEGIKKLRTPY